MAVQDKLYTANELWELTKLPEFADVLTELWEGVIVTVAPSSAIPGIVAANLAEYIGAYVRQNKLGYVSTAEGGYELSPNNVLAPDVGFISRQRVNQLPTRYFKSAPDLAVEVVSPTDAVKAVMRKAAKYISYGTGLVWIVYPADKTVDVCRPSKDGDMSIQEIRIDGTLDGETILPGFTLPVRDVFAVLDSEDQTD